MRIDLLCLVDFKNLKDFEVDFDLKSPRQVIVGRNGVGKSNLLEAIGYIFRDLDLEEDPVSPSCCGYLVEYHCNGHFVRITSARKEADDPKSPFTRTYEIASDCGNPETEKEARTYQTISQAEFYRRNRALKTDTGNEPNPDRLLPLYVFGYYSGVSGRFNDVFARHEELYYKQQIRGEEAPLRPLFLAKPHHSQFSLLSFFAAKDETAQTFLRQEFRIAGLDSVLFALHEPYWNKRSKQVDSSAGDHRFWKTAGKVSPLLDSLFTHALAPMAGEQPIKISIGQEKNKERRFLFLPSQQALQAVAEGLQPKEFFSRLESAIFSDVVTSEGDDVRIRVKLTDANVPVLFKELSEGEQQLLTLIGLMRFTAQNESLFLLDEPDTHLNLLKQFDVHTLLRLPTGIFYAQGVKANVLFFDAKPAQANPWTTKVWVYDMRTNNHFTLRTNPLRRADLDEFVKCYNPSNRHRRRSTWSESHPDRRWRSFEYHDLMMRDKVNLDIFWLKDKSLEDSDDLPAPDILAQEIADDLQTAMELFSTIARSVKE